MENGTNGYKTDIGWNDVFDLAGAMTMFFCYFVNKKVSHSPWLYIIGGMAAVAVGGGPHTVQQRPQGRQSEAQQ